MAEFRPFADDAAAVTLGDLKLENGREAIALYGNLDITRDQKGLQQARALKAHLDRIVQALEQAGKLPESVAPPAKPGKASNPFA